MFQKQLLSIDFFVWKGAWLSGHIITKSMVYRTVPSRTGLISVRSAIFYSKPWNKIHRSIFSVFEKEKKILSKLHFQSRADVLLVKLEQNLVKQPFKMRMKWGISPSPIGLGAVIVAIFRCLVWYKLYNIKSSSLYKFC